MHLPPGGYTYNTPGGYTYNTPSAMKYNTAHLPPGGHIHNTPFAMRYITADLPPGGHIHDTPSAVKYITVCLSPREHIHSMHSAMIYITVCPSSRRNIHSMTSAINRPLIALLHLITIIFLKILYYEGHILASILKIVTNEVASFMQQQYTTDRSMSVPNAPSQSIFFHTHAIVCQTSWCSLLCGWHTPLGNTGSSIAQCMELMRTYPGFWITEINKNQNTETFIRITKFKDISSGGSRIPREVANLLFGQVITKNYMKMKNKPEQVEGGTGGIPIALCIRI